MKKILILLILVDTIVIFSQNAGAIQIDYSYTNELNFEPPGYLDPLGLEGGTIDVKFSLDSNATPDSFFAGRPNYYLTSNMRLTKQDGSDVFDGSIFSRVTVFNDTLTHGGTYDLFQWKTDDFFKGTSNESFLFF